MRPLLALILVASVFGSVQAFMLFQANLPAPQVVQRVTPTAGGVFSLELVTTFDVEADAFALEPTAVLVQLGGEDLLRSTERLAAGTPIVIDEIAKVAEGRNSFFVKVAGEESGFDVLRAVRLRVLRDGQPLAERTLWSAPGEPVEGVIEIDVPALRHPEHSHDH